MSVARQPNSYDKNDIVRRNSVIIAGGLKMAAYQVRDTETGELSKVQFHVTWENMVLAVMSEETAKLFCKFVDMTLNPKDAAVEAAA